MKIGPRYKIAKRLGAPIFEKTQTQKFALRSERGKGGKKFGKPKSSFGMQMNEKQKIRFSYGITEKQLKNYVNKILLKKSTNQNNDLFGLLEKRLDNVVWRSGFASTRRAARQIVSHGHILVNGKKTNIPSYELRKNDVISWREGSKNSPLFLAVDERAKDVAPSNWIKVDLKKKEAKIEGDPKYNEIDSYFNISSIFEYYRR